MARAYGQVGAPPEGFCHFGAWSLLQGASPGYGPSGPAGDAGATFRRGAVSLPQDLAGQVAAERLLPAPLRATLKGGEGLLRSEREAAEAIASFEGCLAMDGKLRREPRDYTYLLEELLQKGIVEGCESYTAGWDLLRSEEGPLAATAHL